MSEYISGHLSACHSEPAVNVHREPPPRGSCRCCVGSRTRPAAGSDTAAQCSAPPHVMVHPDPAYPPACGQVRERVSGGSVGEGRDEEGRGRQEA